MAETEKKSPLDDTLLISFQAKWLPGLAEFVSDSWLAPGWWGIQFQPAGDHHATIVAQDGAAMVVIQDPKTVLTATGGAVGKTWDVSFRPEFIARCKPLEFEMRSSEGDSIRVPAPDWQTAETGRVRARGDVRMPVLLSVIAFLGAEHEYADRGTTSCSSRKTNAGCTTALSASRVPWEVIDAKSREAAPPPDVVRLAAGYLAKLAMFGQIAEGTFGRDGLSRWTFADAPEVTVYIMPWARPAADHSEEEPSDV